ncbi:hypothetical protein QQG55_18405 [Brugia pahangi]
MQRCYKLFIHITKSIRQGFVFRLIAQTLFQAHCLCTVSTTNKQACMNVACRSACAAVNVDLMLATCEHLKQLSNVSG